MVRIITLSIITLILAWQGYLIYVGQELVTSIEAMDSESPFSFFASASIPFYIAYFIATCVLGGALLFKAGSNKVLQISSVVVCAFGTGFMQLHILYASYSPIFELSP